MAIFADDDTLILNAYTCSEDFDREAVACWAHDIPSGGKLPYYATDQEAESLGFSQLGVMDLEQMVFSAFGREGEPPGERRCPGGRQHHQHPRRSPGQRDTASSSLSILKCDEQIKSGTSLRSVGLP